MSEQQVRHALEHVKYPGFSRDVVSFGLVKSIVKQGDTTIVSLVVPTHDGAIAETIKNDCIKALAEHCPSEKVDLQLQLQPPRAPAQGAPTPQPLASVKRVLAVASGKGGVGKSTVAANLAVALAKQNLKVGVCDCDLYGPSMPTMLGAMQQPLADENEMMLPLDAHGIKFISLGLLLDDASPVIVRGPIATNYVRQLLVQVLWGDLDVLVLDLPPGTGDIQLTIVQTVVLSGAVIVTTPQEVALADARRAASMFAKVNVPVLGVIENMSWFECSCGEKTYIFGKNGGAKEAKRLNIPLLAQIPLTAQACECGDSGSPIALVANNPTAAAFADLAASLAKTLRLS